MSSLKQVLFDLGHTKCIALSDFAFDTDPETPSTVDGTLDPSKPAPACFNWKAHTKGPMVGPEGVSHESIGRAIKAGALGGQLLAKLGADYVVTDEDLEVAMHVRSKAGGPKPTVWNNDMRTLGTVAPPAPPPEPPIVSPVTPPVTPPPEPPTVPVTPLRTQRLEAYAAKVSLITDRALAVPLSKGDDTEAAKGLRSARRQLRDARKALNE